MERTKTFGQFNETVYYSLYVKNEGLYMIISSDGKTASTDESFNEKAIEFAAQSISSNANYDVSFTKKDEGIYEITPMPSTVFEFMKLLEAIIKKALADWSHNNTLHDVLEKTLNHVVPQFRLVAKPLPKTAMPDEEYEEEPRRDPSVKLDPNDYEVYWNVIFDWDEKAWYLLIGEDEESMSDDSDWYSDVYDMIDEAIPSYELREDMESYFSIYHRGDKYDGKQVKFKPEAQDFIKKMEAAFPMWGRSNIKHL